MVNQREKPIEIFCLYAPEDEKWVKDLEKHLFPLQRKGQIVIRPGSEINAGQEKYSIIRRYIEQAHVILFFVSPDFVAYDDYREFGVTMSMRKHEMKECQLIPILLRPTMWQNEPFVQLKALPTNNKPVASWVRKDEALLEIAHGIQEVLQNIRQSLRDIIPEQNGKMSSAISIIMEQTTPQHELVKVSTENTEMNDQIHSNSMYSNEFAVIQDKEDNSSLMIQDVLALWANMLSRLKEQNVTLSAHLEFCKVIQVEDTPTYLTLVLQIERDASYEYLKESHHLMDLVAVLMSVFKRNCRVCFAKSNTLK